MRIAFAIVAGIGLVSCAAEPPGAEEPVEASQATISAPEGVDPANLSTSPPARAQVACTGSEEAIFSCKVEGGKHLAVCTAESGHVQYRYGDGDAELVLNGGEWARAAYSGGGEAQIAFASKDHRYIVFSRMVRTNFAPGEPNNPAISDGVIVLHNDEVLAVEVCDDPDLLPVQYDAAERALPLADELFTYETGRADPH